jgi:hypothetical protein
MIRQSDLDAGAHRTPLPRLTGGRVGWGAEAPMPLPPELSPTKGEGHDNPFNGSAGDS